MESQLRAPQSPSSNIDIDNSASTAGSVDDDGVQSCDAPRLASRLSSPVPPRLDVQWPNSPPLTLSLKMSGVFDYVDLSFPQEGDLTRETHRSESPAFDMTYDVQVSVAI